MDKNKMVNSGNLAAVLYGANDIRMRQLDIQEQREIPIPKADDHKNAEVSVAINCVGICASDVHYWTKGENARRPLRAPMVRGWDTGLRLTKTEYRIFGQVLGHESSGTVEAVGKNVTHLKIGDRVAIEPGVPCRHCEHCKIGRYNLCPDVVFCATPPVHGTLIAHYVHPADFCYKLPDQVSFEEAALLEPLAVAVHACRRASLTPGDSLLICGAGPIGLVTLLTAKAMGVTEICITDVNENRFRTAIALGAPKTCLVKTDRTPKECAAELIDTKFAGTAPLKCIECSGAESSMHTAIHVTRSGGVIVLVGLPPGHFAHLPLVAAVVREVDIRSVFRYANCYPTALSLVESGKVHVRPLVTHRFNMSDTVTAFETARSSSSNAIKVIIRVEQQ